jgi:hypothetical protein
MCNLSKKTKLFCLAAVFTSIASGQLLAQTNDMDKSTLVFFGQITNQLSQFDASVFEIQTNASRTPNESFDKLTAVLEQMKGTVRLLEDPPSMGRKELANLWFDVLAMQDKHIDPNFATLDYFKTNDCFLNLVPPQDGPDGPVYASGTAPEALKNPAARAEYEALLKKNKEHINNLMFQDQLQRINNQAMASIRGFILSSYMASELDKNELNEILNQSKLSDARKQKIRSIIAD